MNRSRHVLAIDQGTTSTRSIVFDDRGSIVALARRELPQHYPAAGWVEHDAEDIWRDTLATMREAIEQSAVPVCDFSAIGITNQRETAIVWERSTGRPIHRAIVWQDRRTAAECARLKCEGVEAIVRERTGLLLDPYFSGTKIAWLLEEVAGARKRAERGELAFGTVDSFLLWRLTGGRVHATDVTNASRTMLFDIHRGEWDDDLSPASRSAANVARGQGQQRHLRRDPAGPAGRCHSDRRHRRRPAGRPDRTSLLRAWNGEVHVRTGCFMLLNTGNTPVQSQSGMLTTPA